MLQDILTPKKSLFLAGAHTELRAQTTRQRGVTLLNGNLVNNTRTDTSGISCRVYKNGTCGFSSIAEFSEDAVGHVLKAASDNAAFMDSHAGRGKALYPAISNDILNGAQIPAPAEIKNADQKIYIEYAKELDAYIAKNCPKLVSRTIACREDSQEKITCVIDGADNHLTIPRSYVYVIMAANTKDAKPVELFESFGGEGVFEDNFTNPKELFPKVDTLYAQIMEKAEGIYADAGLKTVILDGMMSGMLAHEAVGHTCEADLVLGGSVAGPSLNKQVASELVSLTDFAYEAFGERAPLPVYVDDEGTPAVDAHIIENGILKGYMNNRELAEHFREAPTGNARAWIFSDEPLIRMRNTAVHPGKDKIEDMIASIDDGYYLIKSGNGQADLTGEFMFGVTLGYEIKNGKIGRALLDTTVSGVAFEMLKTVDMVSDSLVWVSSGFCGKKQPMPVGMGGPALRCKLTIGGR